MLTTIEGTLIAGDAHFGLVVTRFNDFITERLLDAAQDCLHRHGVAADHMQVVRVPGAFELPLVVRRMAKSGHYQGIVALGAVIRGATPHFNYVAGECVKGLGLVSQQCEIPIGFGVLTVDSIEQAIERAGTKAGNKGAEAALATLEMVSLLQQLDS